MTGRTPAWLLQHTTASWREKFGNEYPYACIVDVTFLRTIKSRNIWASGKTYSHYKCSWGVALMQVVAMDGTVLDGEPIPAACRAQRLCKSRCKSCLTSLKEKAWVANKFTEKLTAWAREHGVQLWVAGDKAYGEFRTTTVPVDTRLLDFLLPASVGWWLSHLDAKGSWLQPPQPDPRRARLRCHQQAPRTMSTCLRRVLRGKIARQN